jgi:signal transduction histidine kinase
MRRRLLVSTLAVALTAILLFGLPLAFALTRLEIGNARAQLKRDATTVAKTLQNRLNSSTPFNISDVRNLARSLPDPYVSVSRDGERIFQLGDRLPSASAINAQANTADFRVTVEARKSVQDAGVTEALALVGSLALPAVGVAIVLAIVQARRMARPLLELASAVDRLGSGDGGPLVRRFGVPELDRVAEGLDETARRISDLLAAERQFASDASHQLRTPLTALSMRLEEMLASADQPWVVREEGAAALVQTERLADVVGQLLGRNRRASAKPPERVSVDDVVSQQVVEWEPAFRRENRKLEVTGDKGLAAFVTPGALAQVIATLLDNALSHGAGTVTLRTSQTPKSAVIEVRDEGSGVPPELASRIFERNVSGTPGGTGLGLALARSIAEADGAKVVLVRPKPAVFAIFLPRGLPAAEDDQPVVTGPA